MANASREVADAGTLGPDAPAAGTGEQATTQAAPAGAGPEQGVSAAKPAEPEEASDAAPETLRGEALAKWSNHRPVTEQGDAWGTCTQSPSESVMPGHRASCGVGIGWYRGSASLEDLRPAHVQHAVFPRLRGVSYTARADEVSESLHDSAPPSSRSAGERRTGPRHDCELDVEFEDETHFLTGLSFDLSRGGMFIATYRLLPVGTRITLRFVLPAGGAVVRARGQVKWVRETVASDTRPGMGIAFTSIDPDAIPAIAEFCA